MKILGESSLPDANNLETQYRTGFEFDFPDTLTHKIPIFIGLLWLGTSDIMVEYDERSTKALFEG